VKGWLVLVALVGCGKPAPAPAAEPAHVEPAPLASTPDATPSIVTANAAPEQTLAVPNRPLTEGEIAMITPIFRDGIDYTHVRVIDNSFPLQPENVYMTPRGHIYAPGTLYSSDFSKGSYGTRSTFVHEMTHVWQFTNGMDLIARGAIETLKYRGNYEKAYPYELAADRDLVEYGMEQQASLVEDYFDVMYQHGVPYRMTNSVSNDARDALYAKVLGSFLHDAKYARGLDPDQVAAQHAKDAQRTQPGPEACAESEKEHGTAHLCGWRYEDTSH
jgi:type VI secretion system secreted protein VgrG